MECAARAARDDARVLCGWRSACGNATNRGTRREAGVLGLRGRRDKRERQRVIRRRRRVDCLVAQVANRAGSVGRAVVMVPDDAGDRHADQQQREQRYRDDPKPG